MEAIGKETCIRLNSHDKTKSLNNVCNKLHEKTKKRKPKQQLKKSTQNDQNSYQRDELA